MHPLGKADLALFAACFLLGAQLYALRAALTHTGEARQALRDERNRRLDAEDMAEAYCLSARDAAAKCAEAMRVAGAATDA